MTNFVDNCNFTAGKDGCLMRQHFPSFEEQEAKRKYWSFHEYDFDFVKSSKKLTLPNLGLTSKNYFSGSCCLI